MRFPITPNELANVSKYSTEDVNIARKFAKRVHDEFGNFIRAIVIFGSSARKEGEKGFFFVGTENSDASVTEGDEELITILANEIGQALRLGDLADAEVHGTAELLDQRIDARLIEPQRLHLGDDLVLQLLVFALLRRRQRLILEAVFDILILQPAQLLVRVSDSRESLQNLGL